LLTTAMLVIVFGKIAKLAPADTPQILFYLSGVTAWGYFAECLTKTSTTFKDNAYIFGKVYFPRMILPLSVILSSLLKFAIQFGLFLAVLLYYILIRQSDIQIGWEVLLTPLLLFLMAGISLGSGMIITSMTTKYRDLAFLVQFGIQLLMYATPVIQPLSNILNSQYKYIILLNPITPVIETFRVAFLGHGIFSWAYLGYSFAMMIILLAIGFYIFNRTEQSFTDTV
jgi:lipopolysaccharide transport system permease protein